MIIMLKILCNVRKKYHIAFYMKKKIHVASFAFMSLFVFCGVHSVHAAGADDFVITVKTDNTGSSSNTQFTIPTTDGG
ncbi:MAG: hypothetical protein CR972_01320, partial [Candidatus Moraniibacteriota bacterium]